MTDRYALGTERTAFELAAAEITRAREKHGASMESGNGDKRLRILTEEVGEIARALDDIEQAEMRRENGARWESTTWLEGAREAVLDARAHLLEEVVQVAATAIRWAAAELATESARAKLAWDSEPPLQARAVDLHHSQGVAISEVIAAAERDLAIQPAFDRFMECAPCAAKPGSPTLCASCVWNRDLIDKLSRSFTL